MKEHTYNLHEHLTQHYTLREMLYSPTAQRLGMLNPIDSPVVVDNLRLLCDQVLEPLRLAMNEPIVVCSGYRSDCLNYVVGGRPDSQHRLGEAVHIYCQDEWQARFYYDYMRLHLHFDQLHLVHHQQNGAWWVHVSYTTRYPLRQETCYQAR